MAASVTHSTVVVVADDGTSPVGTDEWNATHTVSIAATDLSDTPSGELGGTWSSVTVDSSHAGGTHAATQAAAEATASSALTTHAATSHPPISADYLVGTANSGLSAEIVVGTSPGGELGNTWASPTVDASHSGSTHAATQAAAEATAASALTTHAGAADPHTGYLKESDYNAKGDLISASANDTPSTVTVGANDTILMADSAQTAGLKWVAPATPAAVSTAAAEGTSDTYTRGDHVHAHETAHINHDTTWAAKGDLIAATANDTAAVVSVGADGLFLKADSGASTGVSWAAPTASVTDPNQQSYTPGTFTVATGKYIVTVNHTTLTTSQRITLAGTARWRHL